MDRHFWSPLDVRALITVWAEDNIQQQIDRVCWNEAFMKYIAAELAKLGILQTTIQIREKRKKLKAQHKSAKLNNGRIGVHPKRFPHYNLMDSVLEHRPCTRGGTVQEPQASESGDSSLPPESSSSPDLPSCLSPVLEETTHDAAEVSSFLIMATYTPGVLNHLDVLEMEALELSRLQKLCLQQQCRVDDLRILLEKLRAHRDQLKARGKTTMSLQQLKAVVGQRSDECNDDIDVSEEGSSQAPQSELCFLMARRIQVKHLLQAHHLIGTVHKDAGRPIVEHFIACERMPKRLAKEPKTTIATLQDWSLTPPKGTLFQNMFVGIQNKPGGYDVMETRRGKGMCISIATAFEGLYLETYSLEVDISRARQICRHNIPPFIPLEKLAQVHLQTDLTGFFSTLSSHLNAFSGRRQQVRLIQEDLRDLVEVMESNMLFSTIVLMCKDSGGNGTAVLCTLQYSDLSRYLPTMVTIDCEDEVLPSTPQWKEIQSLLLCTPAHRALQALKMKGQMT